MDNSRFLSAALPALAAVLAVLPLACGGSDLHDTPVVNPHGADASSLDAAVPDAAETDAEEPDDAGEDAGDADADAAADAEVSGDAGDEDAGPSDDVLNTLAAVAE